MKRYLLFLLLLLAASPGWARPRVETANNLSRTQNYAITFTIGDTSDSEAIPVSGFCSVRYQQSSGDDASLYAVTTATTASTSGTLIGAFTASTTTATTFTAGTRWVKAVGTDTTAGGSVMTIDCAPLTGGGGGGAVNAASYEPGDAVNALLASITDPSTTQLGVGISFGDPATFAANPDGEADNLMGFFYNKSGINYIGRLNQYEHAMDDSYETAYRHTAGTSDHTWFERNLDLFLPDNSVTLSSIHANFNPAIGETVYFSGGGQGKVISWSSPTLTWRQDFGATAAGETVYDDDGNPAETATLGTPSAIATQFRTYQWEWDSLLNQSKFFWYALSGDQTGAPHYEQDDLGPAFQVRPTTLNGRSKIFSGINATPATGSQTFVVQDSALFDNQIMTLKYVSAGQNDLDAAVGTNDGWGGGSFRILQLQSDYSATNTAFGSPMTMYVPTPTTKGSGSTVERPTVFRIDTQGGHGATGGTSIFIRDQTCLSAGDCAANPGRHGNLLFGGGNWNDGHLSFGDTTPGYDEDADHLYRDQTNEVFRATTDDAPDSETDGVPVVTGSGNTAHGPAIWAISDAGSFDTGTEVCATAGRALTCQDVIEFSTPATPTDSACATTHSSGVKFIAMCY